MIHVATQENFEDLAFVWVDFDAAGSQAGWLIHKTDWNRHELGAHSVSAWMGSKIGILDRPQIS